MKRLLNFKLLLLFTAITVFAAETNAQAVSNRGKEFWVSYGHHQGMNASGGSMEMVIYLSTDAQAAIVDVEIVGPGNILLPNTIWRRRYSIPPYTAINTGTTAATPIVAGGTTSAAGVGPSTMPKSGTYDCRLYSDDPPVGWGGAGKYKRAIKITSNVPIVSYAHIYDVANSGATMLLPIEAWGFSYTSLNSKQSYAANCYNWTYIIAKENDTKVEITPSVKTRAQDKTGLSQGVATVITLSKGDVYQLVGANDGADANGNGGSSSTGKELTGTKIRSVPGNDGVCKTIAVFAGSSRTTNPASCGSGGGDSDNQQLFPEHTWGTEYLTSPFSGDASLPAFATCTYKIAVSDPSTVVKRNGTTLTGLQNGNYYVYESSTPDRIEADKPIMMCQFMTGGGCIPGSYGDPEMVVISPRRQAVKRTVFYRNSLQAIQANFLSLVIPTAGIASLKIDNSSVFDYVGVHPNKAGYSIVVKKWSNTPGQSIAVSDSAFNGIVYGLGSVESYGYNAGTNLDAYRIPSGSFNIPDTTTATNVSHPYGFVGIPMQIGAQLTYKPIKIIWKLTQITPAVALTANPGPVTDVVQMLPTPIDSVFTTGIGWLYIYRLPGTYTFPAPGIFTVPLELTAANPQTGNACNIDNKEDVFMDIEIKVKPSVNFNFTSATGCDVVNPITFTTPNVTPEGLNVIRYKWYFSTNPADTSSLQNPVFSYATPGTYNVKLVIVTAYGGTDSVTKSVTATAGVKPHSSYTAVPDTLCLGQSVVFTPTSSVTGTTGWYWDFDNGTVVTETTNTTKTITYTTPGTYNVRHTILGSGSSFPCLADTVKKTIVVAITPAITSSAVVSPTTCNGTDGSIQLLGLQNNTTYAVTYTISSTTITTNLTSDGTGMITIPNLGIGTYTNISVKIGNCTSNSVASLAIVNPSAPATPTAGSNSPICQNDTLKLTASTTTTGTISYVWSGPNGFVSTDQNPIILNASTATAGTYSVVAIKDNCSSVSGSVTVTVTANPIIGSTSKTDPTACAIKDGTISLNGLTPSTTYTISYSFNSKDTSVTITTNGSGVAIITGLGANTYSTITASLGACKSSAVGPFTLNDPSPPATPVITSNSPVCSGSTLNLSATSATSGVTFNWTGPNGFTATGATPTISNVDVTAGGTYNVTATLNACVSVAGTATITVKQTPSISSSSSTNPTACASATGTIVLNGLQASTSFTINYTAGSTPTTVTLTSDATGKITITGLPAGTYSGITASANSCTSQPVGPFTLSDPTPPATPTASSNSPLCNGSKLDLTATSTTSGVSYSWTGPNGFTSNVQNPSINSVTNIASGTYSVTTTLNSCTSAAGTVSVTVNKTPVITSSSHVNTSDCSTATGSIKLNGLDANTAYTVEYTKGTLVTSTITSDAGGVVTIPNLTAGSYTNVSVTVGVCKSNVVGPFNISDPTPPSKPVVANNGPLCADATLSLTSHSTTPGVTYAWTGPGGFTSTDQNINIPNATTAISGIYTVTVTLNSCKNTASTNVEINPNPIVDFSTSTFVCMPNNPVKFTNASSISSGTLNYSWNFGDGSPTSNSVNPSHVYAAIGNYSITLTATSNKGCSKQTSKNFDAFYDKPIANFNVTPSELCQGIPNVFDDLSTAPNSTIATRSWNFGLNSTWVSTTSTSQTMIYPKAGIFTIQLQVKNPVGCTSDIFSKQVKVYVQPVIDAGPAIYVPTGTVVKMNPTVNDSSSSINFTWTPPGDFSNPTILRPLLTVNQNKIYTLSATGQGNCTATDTIMVVALKKIEVPNAFSPNGDGINDTWEIKNLKDYPIVTVEIFNRYGQKVYNSNRYSASWDGRVNGKPIPVGVYYYIIDFRGHYPTLTGSLTILR